MGMQSKCQSLCWDFEIILPPETCALLLPRFLMFGPFFYKHILFPRSIHSPHPQINISNCHPYPICLSPSSRNLLGLIRFSICLLLHISLAPHSIFFYFIFIFQKSFFNNAPNLIIPCVLVLHYARWFTMSVLW